MTHAPAQLDYARGLSWHKRPWTRRATLAAVLVLSLVASRKWLAAAWDHGRLLYWQGQCLSYTAPPEYLVARLNGSQTAACWAAFYARFSPPGRNPYGTVFLHEMRKQDGSRRLVAVEVSRFMGLGSNPDVEFSMEFHVIDPATPWRSARLVGNGDVRPTFWYEGGGAEHFEIRAGQPDQSDRSHFTVEVAWKGRATTLDGWLREDDTVVMEPRERLDFLGISKY